MSVYKTPAQHPETLWEGAIPSSGLNGADDLKVRVRHVTTEAYEFDHNDKHYEVEEKYHLDAEVRCGSGDYKHWSEFAPEYDSAGPYILLLQKQIDELRARVEELEKS